MNYLFQNTVTLLMTTFVNGRCEIATLTRISRRLVRQIDAGDLDDRLPRGFLAGAVVKVLLALHLNRA